MHPSPLSRFSWSKRRSLEPKLKVPPYISVYCSESSFSSSETTREVYSNPEHEYKVFAQMFLATTLREYFCLKSPSTGGFFSCTLPKSSSELGRWRLKDTFHWFRWETWNHYNTLWYCEYRLTGEVVNESILFGHVHVKFFRFFRHNGIVSASNFMNEDQQLTV